jgi:hypothetical protein
VIVLPNAYVRKPVKHGHWIERMSSHISIKATVKELKKITLIF